mmetsp:Transcript_19755/g.48000  ORF Transcript_19755/g.48000 Transcript_19755/m.48000 type:complete len:280 (+) Transcript_19755:45-884(+)
MHINGLELDESPTTQYSACNPLGALDSAPRGRKRAVAAGLLLAALGVVGVVATTAAGDGPNADVEMAAAQAAMQHATEQVEQVQKTQKLQHLADVRHDNEVLRAKLMQIEADEETMRKAAEVAKENAALRGQLKHLRDEDAALSEHLVPNATSFALIDAGRDQNKCSKHDQELMNKAGSGNSAQSFPGMAADCGNSNWSVFGGMNKDNLAKCIRSKTPISNGCSWCFAMAGSWAYDNCKWACSSSWCSKQCLDCTAAYDGETTICTGLGIRQRPRAVAC